MKVEIEFEQDHETGNPILIDLGRIRLGSHTGKLLFTPEGNTILAISEKAIEDKSLILTKDYDELIFMSQFMKPKAKKEE